jgi:hypothetical protein
MTLGTPRKFGNIEACSMCGAEIPDDHVPLILWETDNAKRSNRMWVYCEQCEGPIITTYMKVKSEN